MAKLAVSDLIEGFQRAQDEEGIVFYSAALDSEATPLGESLGLAEIQHLECLAKILSSKKSSDKTSKDLFDFNPIFDLYPHPLGRSAGINMCRKRIKTPADYENLKAAVLNYRKYTDGRDRQYIMLFKNFMKAWEDWIPGGPDEVKPSQGVLV